MKRLMLITVACLLCNLWSNAQAIDFEKYADMDDVTSVYISPAMMGLVGNIDLDVEDVEIGKMAGKLEELKILNSETPKGIRLLKEEARKINAKNGYEELMRVNDEGDKTTIYMKQGKEGKNEFVLVNEEEDGELSIIIFLGNLTLKDVKKMMD
ncbi:MAG: DUF4252 domain-containing protein [Bacteroides sp.]|nr:DUF4252 domain-containing protein [Bacteroides sp.]